MDKGSNIGHRLKHRIAQMLLSSSCTTTSTINSSDKISQEPIFPSSNRHVHHRGKLDHLPRRMAPVVQVSIDCSSRRSVRAPNPNLPLTTEQGKRKQKKERRVTETGVIYESGAGEGRKCPPASPCSPSNDHYHSHSHSKERKKAMIKKKKDKFVSKKKKLLSNGYGFSPSSSSGSNDEFGFFSSEEGEEEEEEEEEEETWTLFSSKSFSSDSSEFYLRASSKKKTKNKKSTRRPPRKGATYFKDSCDEGNQLQPFISISSREEEEMAAEVARSGSAVVKRSSNPYEDFRSSMLEMIIEMRMSEPEDLEQLLHSYLSLNSPSHHAAILEAFAGIWEAVFGEL